MTDRRHLLEQVDDVAVVQLYADGFDSLPLELKMLTWHLYQAAVAGRDIYYDQRHRDALVMRAVLELVLRHGGEDGVVPAPVLEEIRRYTKLFWIHSGPYHGLTARKFVLRCTPEDLASAVRAAVARGGSVPLDTGETLDQLLARLGPSFFDPDHEPMVTSKSPGADVDLLQASANNLYDGVSLSDLGGFVEKYGLNSRLVRRDQGLVEEVYRPDGRYGRHIATIVDHLRSALPFASGQTRRALEALVRAYESGEADDRRTYEIAWVEDRHPMIDTINGFVEVYLDPRGIKGAWEGLVMQVNTERTTVLERLASAAAWFEARIPCKPEWRRTDVVGVTARAVDVIVETGEAGPLSAIGINLPNDQHIREQYGSKSVSLVNVMDAYERSQRPEFRQEFCWSDEEADRAERWAPLAGEVTTAIHEVIGHGSGRVADRLEGQPQLALRETYSTIEETRADLVALYFLPEPRVAALGLLPAAEQSSVVRAGFEAFARTALVQLRRVRTGTTLEEDHMRNRQLIVHWLLAHTDAIDVRVRDGRTFYVVADVEAFHDGVCRLLGEVQDIKSEGDYERAASLVSTYGTTFDPRLRDEIAARVDRHGLPSLTAFVQPKLEPVTDESGQVMDVRITYPQDLERQMLGYAEA